MVNISSIKEKLRLGDIAWIAETVGCDRKMVEFVLEGERGHRINKGKKIVEVAIALISAREEIETRSQDPQFSPSQKTYWIPITSNV